MQNNQEKPKKVSITTFGCSPSNASYEKFKREDRFYLYMLECADGTYYTGSTRNLEKRVSLHNKGNGAKYLKGKLPVKLVYAKEYRYYKNVLHAERNLKKLTRIQKEILIKIYGEKINGE